MYCVGWGHGADIMCIALVGGMVLTNAMPASAGTGHPQNFKNTYDNGMTARGSSEFNNVEHGDHSVTSCSAAVSVGTRATLTYYNHNTGKTESVSAYDIGQYGAYAKPRVPATVKSYVKLKLNGTHSYPVDGTQVYEYTEVKVQD